MSDAPKPPPMPAEREAEIRESLAAVADPAEDISPTEAREWLREDVVTLLAELDAARDRVEAAEARASELTRALDTERRLCAAREREREIALGCAEAAEAQRQQLLDAVFDRSAQEDGHAVSDAVARIETLYRVDAEGAHVLVERAEAAHKKAEGELDAARTRVRELTQERDAAREALAAVLAVPGDDHMAKLERTLSLYRGLATLWAPWDTLPEDAQDPNRGRECVCGVPIRQGCRHLHKCPPNPLAEAHKTKFVELRKALLDVLEKSK